VLVQQDLCVFERHSKDQICDLLRCPIVHGIFYQQEIRANDEEWFQECMTMLDQNKDVGNPVKAFCNFCGHFLGH
jgi:hypothetical protein